MSGPWFGAKRWRLRDGATENDLIALVRDSIVPHYGRLDSRARLGLLRSDVPDEYVATQTWPSTEYRQRVCSGSRYRQWWAEYEPVLARFDELVDFVDEWDGTELL